MDFSVSSLFAGFVFGVCGLYLLRWGQKKGNIAHILLGLVLMVYPYFVSNDYLLWGIGFVLLFVAYRIR